MFALGEAGLARTQARSAAGRPRLRLGLAVKLAVAFIGLVSLVLAVSGGLDMWLGYHQAKDVAVQIQREKARDAANQIAEFISDIETELGWTTPGRWDALPLDQRRYDFLRLLREVPAISEVAEIDGAGKEQLRVSRRDPQGTTSGADFSTNPAFVEAEANGVYFGPVFFRNGSDPYMTLAVAHAGSHAGVTVATVNLKFVWNLINAIQVGRNGYAFVVDRQGRLVADRDIHLVLKEADWSQRPQVKAVLAGMHGLAPLPGAQIVRSHSGIRVLAVYALVPRLHWLVFVELPMREALAPVYALLYRSAALLVLGLLLAVALGTMLARRLVVPIRRLQDGADRLGSGERSEPIEIHTGDEIELLAERFNQMAAKIQEAYETLEAKVEARTRELQASEQTARDSRLAAERALSDLQRAQDRLVETQKLAALGQLTAGIAHEIKNPLNFVNNFAELSEELVGELQTTLARAGDTLSPEARAEIEELAQTLNANLDKIVEHGKRADSIVRNMLMHSRAEGGERRRVNLNALVEEALNLAYHGARAEYPDFNVELRRDYDPALGEIDVFPQELTRVLLNLFSNAVYAMRERRRSRPPADYAPVLSITTRAKRGGAEISVRDNGTGMAAAVKAQIFNPFFTTKPAGEGTGLGLSLSHDIVVKQHGGSLEVVSEPGEFTEFIVTLPAATAAPASRPAGGTA